MGLAGVHIFFLLGAAAQAVGVALVPLVLVRRKEPSSTVAWILTLVFFPVFGAILFLFFGRDRVRIPVRWKREADREHKARARLPSLPASAHHEALARLPHEIDRDVFRVGKGLEGAVASAGNRAELLVDGDATFAAIEAAIDGAKKAIVAEYFLVRNDATAARFRDRLIAAEKRGAHVRLLLDGYGCFFLSHGFLAPLRACGAEVAFFLPARLILFQPMNLRNHRKIVVVDGEVGFTGGINVGDEYRGLKGAWRDAHLRLEGPCVRELERVFDQDWYFATKKDVPALLAPDASDPVESGDATVAIVRSGPDMAGPKRETIHRLFFAAITRAERSVFITTPYFIPDPSILVALQTAALRGVDVRLLFPSASNHPMVWHAARTFYEALLDAGVAIYEYGPGMIHAKTMVVDGSLGFVGSANMDLRSFRLNFEVHAVVRDAKLAKDLEECFEKDLAVSMRVDPQVFARRPVGFKIIEGVARLLSPLM